MTVVGLVLLAAGLPLFLAGGPLAPFTTDIFIAAIYAAKAVTGIHLLISASSLAAGAISFFILDCVSYARRVEKHVRKYCEELSNHLKKDREELSHYQLIKERLIKELHSINVELNDPLETSSENNTDEPIRVEETVASTRSQSSSFFQPARSDIKSDSNMEPVEFEESDESASFVLRA